MAKPKSDIGRPPKPPNDGDGGSLTDNIFNEFGPWITPTEPEPETDEPNPVTLEVTSSISKTANRTDRNQGVTTMKRGDPVPYIFGTALIDQHISFIAKKPSGASGLFVDYILSTGECNDLLGRYVGSDPEFYPMSKDFQFWNVYMGEASQTASPLMVSSLGAYDTLDGICHVVARMNQYSSFDIKFLVEGVKLRDPRLSPIAEAFSSNPALALARVYTDCGYSVNDTATADAANYCDELIGSPAVERWTFELPIFNRQNLHAWAHTLAQYCGALHIDIRGGEVILIPNKKVTTSPQITHTITADDFQEPPRTTQQGLKQVPEQVIVHYREADGTTPAPAKVGTAANGISFSRLRLFL